MVENLDDYEFIFCSECDTGIGYVKGDAIEIEALCEKCMDRLEQNTKEADGQ